MKTSLTKIIATVSVFCTVFLFSGTALAGGSSHSFNTYGQTGLVQSANTLRNAFKINVETYFNTDYFQINQIEIKSIKLSCEGDNALESAQLRLGSTDLAYAKFVPSTLATNWYKAILSPEKLILENDSVHNLSIDIKVLPNVSNNMVALCKAEIIDYEKLFDNTSQEKETGGSLNIGRTEKTMIINTPFDKLYMHGQTYRSLNKENGYPTNRNLTITGRISRVSTGHYQIKATYSNWVLEGMFNVMIPLRETNSIVFDITSPTFFSLEDIGHYVNYEIQDMHLYKEASENGAIGSITLGNK